MSQSTKADSFEDKLSALEALVEKMESGDLKLEEALKNFEHGVALARECQTALKEAEQKVDILINAETGETAPFDTHDSLDGTQLA